MQSKKSAFTLIELSIVLIIIGLLVSGVVAGKIIINKAKLASARSATKSSPVAQIEDLVLWLDAASAEAVLDDNNNPVDDGDTVASWSDINPQGDRKNHATQTTSNNQPTYQESGFNGLPTLQFDGTSSHLTFARDSVLNEPMTIFTVHKADIIGDGIRYLIGKRKNSEEGPLSGTFMLRYTGNGNLGMYSGGNESNVSFVTPTNTEPTLLIAQMAVGRNNTIEINYEKRTGSELLIYTNNTSGFNPTIGKVPTADSSYFQGSISEIIIYNRLLSNTQINAIKSYLNDKWSVY